MIFLNLYCSNKKCSKHDQMIHIKSPGFHGNPKKDGWIFKQYYCDECKKPIESKDELIFKPSDYIKE